MPDVPDVLPPAAPGASQVPTSAFPLTNVVVTLRDGSQRRALKFGWQAGDPWLLLDGNQWVAAGNTDFLRSPAYQQVAAMWSESGAVVNARRALVRDLLRARRASEAALAEVDTLRGDRLRETENGLTAATLPAGYAGFRD
ncbi:MAG: hypothetical protein JXQ72_09095, partial [Anaerolineae bacterium]|nr:hypothetical protein [Anaerolineae bacterium]